MIGKPEWNDDLVLHNPTLRAERYDELTPQVREWTTARTTAEIVALAALFRVPAVDVGHGGNVAAMDHFRERRFFQRSSGGDFLQPSPPVRYRGDMPATAARPAAALGPRLVDSPMPMSSMSRVAFRSGADSVELPFAGLRILDLTAYWAGPIATHFFAMLGAEVIHVESPRRLDGARVIVVRGAPADEMWEWSHAFQGVNTNKLGVALDVGMPAGREVLQRLVAGCDAVVENFSPRVLDGWDLELRPDQIVVRMPAFGLDGPWRDRTGFAMTMEQVSGLAWLTGRADGPPVTLLGPCDPVGGAHATIALLGALAHRDRTGEGMLVEVPMVASALNMAAEQVITYSATGVRLERNGNRGTDPAVVQNLYRAGRTRQWPWRIEVGCNLR